MARPQEEMILGPTGLPYLAADPLVSILISNFNQAAYLEAAIASCFVQTWTKLEIVCCDDGSTDRSRSILHRLASRDPRLTVVEQANQGQAAGLNAAFNASSGQIICFLDADDLFSPEKVREAVMHLRQGAGLFVHHLECVDEHGRPIRDQEVSRRGHEEWIADRIVARGGGWTRPPTSGLAIRSEVAACVFPIPDRFHGHVRTKGLILPGADDFIATLAPLLAPVSWSERGLGSYRVHGDTSHHERFDSAVVNRYIALRFATIEAVNARLAEQGSHVRLDAMKDVTVREAQFLRAAYSGVRRGRLLGEVLRLVPAVWSDVLRSRAAKLGLWCLYASVIVLPVHVREDWITAGRRTLVRMRARMRR